MQIFEIVVKNVFVFLVYQFSIKRIRYICYLQYKIFHDSVRWRLEHHGQARESGHHDHNPVHICHESQEITENFTYKYVYTYILKKMIILFFKTLNNIF